MNSKSHQNLIVTLVVAVCGLSLFAIASADTKETTRGNSLLIEDPASAPRFSIAALRQSSATEFTSKIINTDFPFNAVSFSWEQSPEATITLWARFQKEDWTEWQKLSLDGDLMENSNRDAANPVTALIFTPYTNILQYKFEFANEQDRQSLKNLSIDYIDSTKGNKSTYQIATDSSGLSIVNREQWGADESFRFAADGTESWPREYYTPKRFIVHHTDSSDVSNPMATLRAIYYFHTKTHDWGDIGYNYLIDSNGTIYEGRAGGDGVVGAHAVMNNRGSIGIALLGCYHPAASNCKSGMHVTPAAEQALEQLIAVKSQQFGIDPQGKADTYDHGSMPTVIGHRDVGSTNCPGSTLYTQLPTFRNQSKTVLASMTPLPALPISAQLVSAPQKVSVPMNGSAEAIVTFKNTGQATWRGYEDDHVMVGTEVKKLGLINSYRIAQTSSSVSGFKLVEGNVRPGEIGTFKIVLQPHDGTKTYTLAWSDKGYIAGTDVSITAVAVDDQSTYTPPQRDIIAGTIIAAPIPETLPIKKSQAFELLVMNSGNVTWEREKLSFSMKTEVGISSPLMSTDAVLPNEARIAPGEIATFVITMQGPQTQEVFRHIAKVTYGNTELLSFFSQTMTTTAYSATITSETLPDSMKRNSTAPVTIKIKNIGSEPWKGFQLKTTNERGLESALYHKSWKARKIIASETKTVLPGEEVEIKVSVWAPTKAGTTTQLYKLWTGRQVITLNGDEILERKTLITK